MGQKLRALIAEDSKDDFDLLLLELKRGGFDVEWKRVWTPEEFTAALKSEWDIVLSDFSMPRFNARTALELLKATGKDLPFIIVSGSIGEAVAVEAMKVGAHDFFPKTNLTRLPLAVEREVKEARIRRERGAMSQQLREAERRYRLVVQHVRDYAIFFLDQQGRVATWSEGARRIFGWDEKEAVGLALSTFWDGAFKQLERALKHGVAQEEGEARRKDNTRFWAERDLELIRERDQVLGYAVVLRDATERKRFVDELRHAISARDEFLSIASHELKTPLTSLKLQLEGILRANGEVSRDELVRKTSVLKRQTDRLAALVGTLLDVTRVSAGPMVLEREAVDLVELVRVHLERTRELTERSGSKVTVTAPKQLVGQWDRARLETVLENLLSNAVKFGEGRPIDVAIAEANGRASLTVTDRGIGIPEEDQARIFGRFERAVPDRHYGGLGIGLWFARQVVEAHGGDISVSSRPGEGSAFRVELPLSVG